VIRWRHASDIPSWITGTDDPTCVPDLNAAGHQIREAEPTFEYMRGHPVVSDIYSVNHWTPPITHLLAAYDKPKMLTEAFRRWPHIIDATMNGLTVGHISARAGSQACLQSWLSAGGDMRAVSMDGSTVAHAIAISGSAPCWQSCSRHASEWSAICSMANRNGVTPLMMAAGLGHDHMMDHIVASGCPVNAHDGNAMHAGHYAAVAGHRHALRRWISHGGGWHDIDASGRHIGHMAGLYGHHEIMMDWCRAGGDVHARTMHGHTILGNSYLKGKSRCASVAIRAGACISDDMHGPRRASYHAREVLSWFMLHRDQQHRLWDEDLRDRWDLHIAYLEVAINPSTKQPEAWHRWMQDPMTRSMAMRMACSYEDPLAMATWLQWIDVP
jgi:hypothetical protein